MDGSIKTIDDLIRSLEELDRKAGLEKDSDLRIICEEAFKKLQISKYFKADDIPGILVILKNLPDSVKVEEIGKIDYDAEKLDSKALNKQDLDSLIKDYEEAKDEAIKKVYEQEIYKRTGKENVEQFIKGQKEIAERNKKNLETIEKIDPKLKSEIEQKLENVEQGMEEIKAKKIEEMVLGEKEYEKKELEKEVQKIVKDKEKAREVNLEVIRERAEIKVTKSADEMATKMCEELKKDQVIVSEETRAELRKNILKSWEDGDKLIIPQKIAEATPSKVILEKINIASENFKNENLETIVNYRSEKYKKEVVYELRSNGVKDEKLIKEYAEVAVELKYSTDRIIPEINSNSQEIVDSIYANQEADKRFEVQPENAVKEAKEVAQYLTKSPKKFNKLADRYNVLREKIGPDKLPKIEKIRVTDKLTGLFKEGSEARKWINGAQKMVGIWEKINTFPVNLIGRIGGKVVEKIGGQAAKDFVMNAAAVIAEQGTVQGIKSIALGITGKGAVVAGGGVITVNEGAIGEILTGTGAGKALLGVQKITNGFNLKLLKLEKGVLSKSGNFFRSVGGAAVKVGQAVATVSGNVVAFIAGSPELLGGLAILVVIVFVCVIIFLFAATMSNQQMASTLVPPSDMGNCVLKSEASGGVNCDQNAPENTVAGMDKSNYIDVANRWKDGSNFASVCFNDTVNRALCAGINPTYALWVWLHESAASNYSVDDVEDFGIHYIPENKDFNKQITEFLTLDPAKQCINDPRIGGDYWLAFSANFLNGSDCDPDRPNSITKMTPRQYAAEIREQWGWISSTAIPNGITVPKGGKNCDQIGDSISTYVGNAKEVTDSDGNVWICTENSQSPVGNYDPNAPGLIGVIVDGECSVGDVVVPTKQCDSQWGSVQLRGGNCSNGKPGTICSAGCGPTSVSMLMRHVNGSLTPDNVIFSSGSAYSNMGCEGSSLDQAKTELVKKFGGGSVTYDAVTLGCDEKAIAKWICDGKVVMVLANFYRNSNLELGGHYVMAMGVKGGKIVVQDPFYDTTNTPFDGTAAYGYAHDIKGCLLIDKTAVK